jgi:hypothetical protein
MAVEYSGGVVPYVSAGAPVAGGSGLVYVLTEGLAGNGLAAKGGMGAGTEATGYLGRSGNELKNAPYQTTRNVPEQINGREYSGHALDQMQNRGIMPSVVENTIGTGVRYSTRVGTTGFYDSINNVRVIINSETGRVVTVIKGTP